jgi:hypothetical protein
MRLGHFRNAPQKQNESTARTTSSFETPVFALRAKAGSQDEVYQWFTGMRAEGDARNLKEKRSQQTQSSS